jgi:hypothetical protein
MTNIIPERSRYEVSRLYDGQRIRAPWWKRILGLPHTIELVDGLRTRRVTLLPGEHVICVHGPDGQRWCGRVGDEGVLWPG